MATLVRFPGPADLAVWLGWGPFDDEMTEQAQSHLDRARRVIRSYVRNNGFGSGGDQVADDIAAVILSLAGRSLNNPTSDVRSESGQHSAVPGIGELSLGDRLTLDNYRRKAA